MKHSELSVYDYTDYRQYLADYFAEQKKVDRRFSFQYFSNKAGFKSKSFIHLVINGKKALARTAINNVAQALCLSPRETEYFENMVNFNQTHKVEEKNYYYNKLTEITLPRKKEALNPDQYEFFNNWWNAPIRELVTMPGIDGDDYNLISRALQPPIGPKYAKWSVQLLERLGLVVKEDGVYKQTHRTIHAAEEIHTLAISNFQMRMLELALQSYNTTAPANRDMSTLTFGITEEGFVQLKEKLEKFRQEIAEFTSQFENSKDRVYQMNLQLFPLSRLDSRMEDILSQEEDEE
jgi:uncharacterized protein (TIGR02147 family)